MSVPEAVKKQAEEAQKLYEDAYKEVEAPEEQSDESLAEETPEVEVSEEVSEEVAEEVSTEEQPKEDFMEKYYSLQGKYDAEVPRLMNELQSMKQQLQQLQQQPQRLDDEGGEEVDPRERLAEDYGEGFVDDLRSIFRAEINESIAPVTQRLQATEGMAIKSGQEKYLTRLSEIVPDWQGIMRDPGFVQFVREPDEFSGIPRYTLMQNAETNMDADRMARFYNAYKKKTGKTVTGNSGKKQAALTPGQTSGRGQSRGANEPDYVSAQEIEEFSTEVALRKYVGREAEQEKKQARIDRAIANRWVI